MTRRTVDEVIAELRAIIEGECMERLADRLQEDLAGRGLLRSSAGYRQASKALKGEVLRRDASAIEDIKVKLLAHVKANPGQKIAEIGAALGLTTKDLALPMRKLLKEKEVKKKGEKSNTTYT